MKHRKLLAAALVVLITGAAADAMAHGPRTRVGIGIGIGGPLLLSDPWWPGPYPYYRPYYYPGPVIVTPPPLPPVYIEQYEAPAETAQQYWYYCRSAKGYYPYVKECPEGWQRVLPQPER